MKMQSVLNVIVVYKGRPPGVKSEEYNNVKSAEVREGSYYQIITKDSTKIKIPLNNIEHIVENTVDKGDDDYE